MDIFRDEMKDRLGDALSFSVPLKNHTSIQTGGESDYFYVASDINSLINAITVAKKLNIPIKVIGGGSNIVFSDKGFRGMVIKNLSKNIVINKEGGEVIADSGILVSMLLNLLTSQELGGIEFMAGIPGTLGGAVYGNAGSKSQYIGDFVKGVTLIDYSGPEIKILNKDHDWLDFYYRSSKLKRTHSDLVILTIQMRMAQKRSDEIIKKIQDNLNHRMLNQPLGEKSCGSWFKNPGKLPEQAAGYLLDRSGAKRLKFGGAAFSKKHANFLINRKNASSSDLKQLAEIAKRSVLENFDVNLEEEIEYIGEW
ncbi:MAG: UDP-N-acetylenolpyruvoylglucosamine reductase [bacterium ADurb.Bin212]|nr:MAG: UDP-N-acetylenolpyruvoylglucosamine reductase [bacterium ADurb.Bin212]